ncbi:chromatin assembly factor 1, putative [Theileria equi strain WA]|uniref:Chromatin assembly factor 1, putative n=1 Tax=Theileria equi strain WA TaxID=1537102 RepID=L0AY24_THEEQ|nr:chromatin assembly factor 1, putative [Theileria equi strain WA]AFZ80482.1 chromatin assembly factor 1, putative [Theileria equi strain WA]|eukprot:XP_004830148.1 chromatin assembly factor 1, putative [Theileria equi strain WA]
MEDQRHNWIVNTRVLYDFISSIRLPQQPLCVEFTQMLENENNDNGLSNQQIACGLQRETEEDVSIYVIDVTVPSEPLKEELRRYCKCSDYEGFPLPCNNNDPMYQCVGTIRLEGDVNRILSTTNDHGSIIMAAKTTEVYLFGLKNLSQNSNDVKPIAILKGHTAEGYGLAFNHSASQLASSSEDGLMFIYDLESSKSIYSYSHDNGGLNCVDYSEFDNNICLIATEDGYILTVDPRENGPVSRTKRNKGAQNAISTTSFNSNIFASGDVEGVVQLWDQRNLVEPVHEIKAHPEPIVRLHFNKLSSSLIASASEDSTVCIFDLDSAGKDIEYEEQDVDDDSPPELIFTHNGHQEKIYDFSWSSNEDTDTFITSVGEDYVLQMWQMTADVIDYSSEDE